MTNRVAAGAPGSAYEGAGRQVAVAVRGYSSIIVASDDPVAAAHTAIGIALTESAHRLVMIGDLAGEVGPLQSLVHDDDLHGIFDSFEFGTSFVRIAREVEGAKNVFVMPSGTESAAVREIITSPRWRAFASEFANADELLILVVKSDAPGIAELVSHLDGAVLVGVERLSAAPDANILATIPHPVVIPISRAEPVPLKVVADKPGPVTPLRIAVAAAVLLAIGIGGGALYSSRMRPAPPPADTIVPADTAETVSRLIPAIVPANAADSSSAIQFSIEILASNTAEGANFEIDRHGSQMPAATISLVPIGDTEATWYKVHAGAYADSAEAENVLGTLRRRQIVSDSAGSVVRTPLALRVDSVPAQAGRAIRIRERIRELGDQGVHAYALIQQDGSARIYVGAFDRPQQSSLAATALRVAGLAPVLEYRTGRLQ